MTSRQYCPFHTDEDLSGERVGEDGYQFRCDRSNGHPSSGPHTWMEVPEPADIAGLSGIAEDLGLAAALPAAIAQFGGRWAEFGAVEVAYAEANPQDFADLVNRYSHTAVVATRYSASTFLAGTLGRLSKTGDVAFHSGPATGRWSYNRSISWWALPPGPAWEHRISWADLGRSMDYVPGSIE